ncbi:MAG: HAD family phosphatase [Clostridia bacterium]|nr:HAD family phosphatase [Clostridia bacterium]
METKQLSLSDWLIASDIDGTLNNKRRKLPERNRTAIHQFVYTYGGKFILASGRSIESMRKHFNRLGLNHGYAVFQNGAGIYDYRQEKVLWLNQLSETLTDIVVAAAKRFPMAQVQVVTVDETRMVRPDVGAWILAKTSKMKMTRYHTIDAVPKGDWCKVIFTGLPSVINRVERFVKEKNNGETSNLMRSSICSFEVVNTGTNKGVAVLKVAEHLGIDPSKTAAIGDYFNDYEMLRSVAVPACCGQAPQGMKDIAKLVTCHCNRGAVADLIEYIIQREQKEADASRSG